MGAFYRELWKVYFQNIRCVTPTVYPKKYAHGFCFAVLCCCYILTDFPISIRLTSLALWQSNDCPSASKAALMNMDKYFMWIHYERLHNNNKAKHNKNVCIFLGIYCSVPYPTTATKTALLCQIHGGESNPIIHIPCPLGNSLSCLCIHTLNLRQTMLNERGTFGIVEISLGKYDLKWYVKLILQRWIVVSRIFEHTFNNKFMYRQTSNIACAKSLHMFLVSSYRCLCPIHWSQELSR